MERVPEEPPLNFKFNIIVYGKEANTSRSHSFVIDDMTTGPSSTIGQIAVNIKQTNLKSLRPTLEYNKSGNMMKRSLLFQEALFIMQRLPNYYNKAPEDARKYVFGFYNRVERKLILVSVEDEEKNISELIASYVDFFNYDLAIVPMTQFP
jgi:hypothetical protein